MGRFPDKRKGNVIMNTYGEHLARALLAHEDRHTADMLGELATVVHMIGQECNDDEAKHASLATCNIMRLIAEELDQ